MLGMVPYVMSYYVIIFPNYDDYLPKRLKVKAFWLLMFVSFCLFVCLCVCV